MGWRIPIPLRRRSHLLKLLLLIPVLWLGSLIFFGGADQPEKSVAVPHRISDEGPQIAQVVHPNPIQKVEGFGPPMKMNPDEPEEEAAPEESKNDEAQGNIPKPNRELFDPSLPIYKKGDATQAGESGKAVKVDKTKLSPEERKKFDAGYQNNAFNQYASDLISVHRSLPPTADEECKTEIYASNLPNTSVIICFHNEAWSVLLRTVHSVLERTPDNLLHEIILVDDFSDMEHTKKALEEYMGQFKKVKILRLDKREGLIRARLRGAAIAKGTVLTYLDSHCECMDGWVEPLLDRINRDKKTVVCPVIDVIDDNTFEYHYSKAFFTNVGGFDWSLQFNWHPIPERDRKNRKRHIDPVRSPTMAGGLFSIHRDYFEELGTYDPGFDIWGGENLELSFKIWMCGGILEIVPCSHGDFGDVSSRKKLRENLQCKSFRWYLDNIFPELFVPGDAVAKGEIRNGGDTKPRRCLDCAVGRREKNKPVGLYPCHNQGGNQIRNRATPQCVDSAVGEDHHNKPVVPYPCHAQGGNQYWMLSKDGEIRRDESCVDYAGKEVMIFPCHGMKGNQEWKYNHSQHQLLHVVTGKCLEMSKDGTKLLMSQCDTSNNYQSWTFKDFSEDKARQYGML
uniref:Polypeptide N-acetylgalactosaminyltransferase n=1 Tax=Panagrellus redivivus TaxID=6233 RepID=A0A7E4ZZ18_PANRE